MKFPVEIEKYLKRMRDAYKEYFKLNKKVYEEGHRQSKFRDKTLTEEIKKTKTFHKLKTDYFKVEATHLQTKFRHQKQDLATTEKISKITAKERREQKKFSDDQFKQMRSAARSGGLVGGLVGGGLGIAARGAGAAYSFTLGTFSASYEKYVQNQMARGRLSGLAANSDELRAGLRQARGGGLGFTPGEVIEAAPIMGRSTGTVGPREMLQAMRATGLGGGEVGGVFSTLRQAGMQFGGLRGISGSMSKNSPGGRMFAELIAAGTASGLEHARLPEYFEGVQGLVQQRLNTAAGNVGVGPIAQLLAAAGRTGLSGLQGARGAQTFGQLGNAFLAPGGGEAGMTFMRQAMGFGRPGSNTSFYEAEKLREQGLNPENFSRFMGEMTRQFGGGQEGALAIRETTGLSLEKAEALQQMFASGETNQEKIKELMESAKPLQEQIADTSKNMLGELQRQAARDSTAIANGAKVANIMHRWENAVLKMATWVTDTFAPFIENKVIPFIDDLMGERKAAKGQQFNKPGFIGGQKITDLRKQAGESIQANEQRISQLKASLGEAYKGIFNLENPEEVGKLANMGNQDARELLQLYNQQLLIKKSMDRAERQTNQKTGEVTTPAPVIHVHESQSSPETRNQKKKAQTQRVNTDRQTKSR